MLDPLYEAIGWLLALFYGLIPNLGIAIILLTCTVMLLLFPLTAKQARSMLAMQEVQPELKKLQAKYKGDRAKLVEEQQKLFQEHKVNPLGGCLPLLVQLPIFFALFNVLRNTYKYVPVDSDLFGALCPGGFDTAQACNAAPNLPKHLEFLGMDLSVTATNATGGFSTVLPYFVLVGLVTLVGYFQSKQSQRTQPKGGSNPQMMMIGRVLPIAFGVFSLWFPAGLVLYFLVSNLWRLGQQEVIFRKIHLPHRERQEAKKQGGDKARPPDIEVTSRDAKPAKPEAKASAAEAAPAQTPEDEAPSPAPAAQPTPTRGGGRLRGMLGLPEPNGEPAPARPAKPASPAQTSGARKSGSGGGSRANQGRRRNKKRKR
jgi:YidC/Oxa1 family membrane protein insertase